MMSLKHLVVVAGEESGDKHAASFIKELALSPEALKITGIGGLHMEKAGVKLLSSLARFGVTGFIEILRHARVISAAAKAIKKHLKEEKPDLLVLVDYPGFNLRLAKYAKKIGVPVLYYISPQIWAWKAKRLETIKANVQQMAVILPFEKTIYEQAGMPVHYVGHPLLASFKPPADEQETRLTLKLPSAKKLIALLPGSRLNEIKRHLPVLVEAIKLLNLRYTNLHFAIPIAESLELAAIEALLPKDIFNLSLIRGKAIAIASCSDAIVVASGTASLECALLAKPMCIIYKISPLSYVIARQVIRVPYIGLANLLLKSMVIPELLQQDCNALELTKIVCRLLDNKAAIKQMIKKLQQLRILLSENTADCSITDLVKEELKKTK